MKSNFSNALLFVLKWEGGYSDHPSDRGGKTNQGITQLVYDDWRLSQGLSRQSVIGLSNAERDAIYRSRYWDVIRGDDLPAPVDLVLFDAAVNVGPRQAAKWLQRALDVIADGRIGPRTLAALEDRDTATIARSITDQRRDFYEGVVERDAGQAVFLKGWLNRCDSLDCEALA